MSRASSDAIDRPGTGAEPAPAAPSGRIPLVGRPLLEDRRCRPAALSNPLRRWFAPPQGDVVRLAPRSGETMLDLGAGVGFHAIELLRRVGPRGAVILVDPDGENLAVARRRVGDDPRVRYVQGSAAQLSDLEDASVDRALLSLVLCCLVDKMGAMDELWRVLRPGGRALITYPRRGLRRRRNASLAMSPALWDALVARHPWVIVGDQRGWVVMRHVIEKPGVSVAGPGGSSPSNSLSPIGAHEASVS